MMRTAEQVFLENKLYDRIKKQIQKGIEKYPDEVNSDNLTTLEWMEHQQEELTDALVYNQAVIEKFNKVIHILELALENPRVSKAAIREALEVIKG